MKNLRKIEFQQEYEAKLVAGMYNGDRSMQQALYKYCIDYYKDKYRGIFYAPETVVDEIFHSSFIKFWENIESCKIYVENGIIIGKDKQPLNGSINTYFMGIAKLKYLEWVREHPFYTDSETEMGKKVRTFGFDEKEYLYTLYNDSDNVKLDIIADTISKMPIRCYEILTKFYYENKNLDRILIEIPSIDSKKALKSKKYKCMENLRDIANETYKRYLKDN